MGPNNGENQSGGVATLESSAVTAATPTETGNGLLPTPGASAPEATGVVAQAENIAANAWAGSESAGPTTPGVEAASPTTAGVPEAKPATSADFLKTPDMSSLNATQQNFFQEKAAAQAATPKPGLGNRLLGFIGLRGGIKTETVGQPANAMPDHLKDGVTPPVPNVTPEAAAAVNQEPVMPSIPKAAAQDGISPMGTETPATPAVETPTSTPEATTPASDTVADTPETNPTAASAVKEADDIVKNAEGTSTALDEMDKTTTAAMDTATSPDAKADDTSPAGTTPSPSETFPSYGVQIEASASSGATDETAGSTPDSTSGTTASSTETASAWPSTPASEPNTSGPSAVVETNAVPAVPEYKPSTDMAPAGEATAPNTPPTWSVDASATHPDAPVVGGLPPTPEAPVMPPDPNALKLESTPTPLAGTPTEAPPPFGTGMPPSMGEAGTASATVPTETDAPSPTAPEPAPEPSLGSTSATVAPESSPIDVLGQAGQVIPAAETAGGELPTSGVSAPAAENGVSMGGNVLEPAAVVAEPAGVPSLTAATASETPSEADTALAGIGISTDSNETPTGNGTQGTPPPLATS